MPADLTTAEALLKDIYGPTIENLLPDEAPIVNRFEKAEPHTFDGRNVIFPATFSRNRAVMATAERGRHPTAGQMGRQKVIVPMRYINGQIEVSAQAIELSRTNQGAFARILSDESKGLVASLGHQMGFYVWGNGTGIRCLVQGAHGAVTTVNVDSPGGVAGATNGARFINPGDYVAWVDPATGGLRAGGSRLVTSVNSAGTAFVVSAAIDATVDDNDYVVKAYGNDANLVIEDTEYLHPPHGILSGVDDGAYQQVYMGIPRLNEPLWSATILSNVGALSADIIYRGLDVNAQLGGKVGEFWMEESVRRAFVSLTDSGRRYDGGELMSPDAGANLRARQTFGSLPIYTDRFAPYGMIFGHDFRHWQRYEPVPGKWVDDDGRILRKVSQYDSFEGTYRKYYNIVCVQPNKQVRWDGVTATVAVVHIY